AFIGKVTDFEDGRVTVEIVTWYRCADDRVKFTFKLGESDRKPEKGEQYFVFSQFNDSKAEERVVVQTRQSMFGQAGYRGWYMHRITEVDKVQQIANAFSLKFLEMKQAFRAPVTLDQAIWLVKEGDTRGELEERIAAAIKFLQEKG